MNADELPIPVLVVLVVVAWLVFAALVAGEQRAFVRSVRAQSAQDRVADDGEQNRRADPDADKPTEQSKERRLIHGGRITPSTPILPPGIPSITERLDRWTEE